ncbi:amidohydrolase [Pigmentiphaga sp. H8]|uniref:M20 aminoacylase family protein n=1 Tax=unclassified Pigmentiphaga TaxID=2626614 RepID=UPI000F594571|nr:M20 aminoacylase family protein [Pigmentiphaga sp. H8]AZG11542.1 amidohydrolase [Pigmentiphaga sp. H8]
MDEGPAFDAAVDEARALRRHLHHHPELAFEEFATADLVAGKLEEWGYEVARGVGGTGVVGRLRHGGGTRALGLRADMDALPITEATGLDYASGRPGVMHACGHDGHTAMLLGAARRLAETRRFSGVLNLIFQPAEERGFDSGAAAMLGDGLFERFPCDRIYAIHNLPGAESGVFLFRDGGFLAAGDRVFVTIRGKGGHAARPHQSVDPILAASSIVMNLQSVVARNLDPEEAAVVTVSRFNAGEALNVIPEAAQLGLSIRSFDPAIRSLIKERVLGLVNATAQAYGAEAEVRYVHGYPVVRNDADASALGASVAGRLFGESRVVRGARRSMGSEDFAYMLEQVPGAMIRLGNGCGSGAAGLHTPQYDFNDDNLPHGIRFWTALAETYLVDDRASRPT